ncbi:MAG: conjugal transfer protein TraR [Firmicutes bacterium]|nr:conjugal transfer protein TraR [Bacillota bacterium]
MGKGFFDELRDKLYGEKAELERTLASIDKELSRQLKDSIGELSSYDQHAADLGQETFERGKDIALRENTRRLLDDTNRAIEAMDVGAYGICQTCGRPIDDQRLRAIPWTTQCFECKNTKESVGDRRYRPVEELALPYDLTDPDMVGFDAEDTWQAVARFGTANTPQDIPGSVEYGEVYINADENIGVVEPIEAIESEGLLSTNWDTVYPLPQSRRRRPADGGYGEEYDLDEP